MLTLQQATVAAVAWSLLALGPAWADVSADRAIMKQYGLRPVGSYFMLADEPKLNAMFRDIRKQQKKMADVDRRLQLVDRAGEQNKELIVQYTQQRRILRQRLAGARSARERNQMIAAMNELGDRITLLMQGGEDTEPVRKTRAEASQVREEYAQRVIDLRELHDQLVKKYQQLASDTKLQAAIERLNRADNRRRVLGPTTAFRRLDPALKKLEKTVFSQSIDLHRGPGGLLYVTAFFNGTHAQQIAVDTGASIVTLPEKTAAKAGIEITDQDPSLTLRVADGGTFEARQVTIGSVRVGKFMVQNVTCAVIPDKFADAPPLLGQSFLRHFVYKIDSNSGKLIMTKVETSPSGRPR